MTKLLNPRYKFPAAKNLIKISDDTIRVRDKFMDDIRDKDLVKQSCYVCGGQKFEVVNEIDRYGLYYPTGICEQCGNVQQSRYYDDESLKKFYSEYYRDMYGHRTPKSLFDDQRIRGLAIFEFTKGTTVPKNVLEIGCGAGGILSRYVDIGCEVLGLDFDEKYLEEARHHNIPVRKGSLEQLASKEKFDLIILSHVLEHIKNPSQFLVTLSGHLTDEGVLYIEVPSLDNVKNGGYHYDLMEFFQNAHVIHFTDKSLKLICKKAGLKPRKVNSFIQSCWEKTSDERILSDKEKIDSLIYTRELFNDIEYRRKSVIYRAKFLLRNVIVKSIGILGIKEIVRHFYLKIRK